MQAALAGEIGCGLTPSLIRSDLQGDGYRQFIGYDRCHITSPKKSANTNGSVKFYLEADHSKRFNRFSNAIEIRLFRHGVCICGHRWHQIGSGPIMLARHAQYESQWFRRVSIIS
jgi:hypothetical protein